MPAGAGAIDGLAAVQAAVRTGKVSGRWIVVRQEWQYAQGREAMWEAITHPGAWWGYPPEIEPRAGGAYVTFHGPDGGQRVEDRTLAWRPPAWWAHTFWREVQPSSTVTWQLDEAEGGTHLTLCHRFSGADALHATVAVARGDTLAAVVERDAAGWRRILERLEEAMEAAGPPVPG